MPPKSGRGRGRPRKYGPVFMPKLAGKGAQKVTPVQIVPTKIPKAPGQRALFPATRFCVMRYTRAEGISTAATQNMFGENRLFLLNAIYAPKVSVPAFRVQGYDQIANIYGKYKVFGAKVRIVWTNPSLDGIIVGHRPAQHDNTDYLSSEYVGPAAMKRWTCLKEINDSGKQTVTYTRYFDVAKMEGLTKLQHRADLDDYCAGIASNPSKAPYLEICAANTKDATGATIFYTITIDYYCQLYDKKILSNSAV